MLLGLRLSESEALAEPDSPGTEYITGFEVSDNYASGMWARATPSARLDMRRLGFAFAPSAPMAATIMRARFSSIARLTPRTFDGQDAFAAALVGYEFRPGGLIVKLFAGIEGEDQHIVPHDPNNSLQGSALGLRLQAESWLGLSARSFLSADAS